MSDTKRRVGDEEYRQAYEGVRGDEESLRRASDNRDCIKSVLRQYRQLPPDVLEECGMVALWKALRGHEHGPGRRKFTTSLIMFCHWECLRQLRVLKRQRDAERRAAEMRTLPTLHQDEKHPWVDAEHIDHCLSLLPARERELVCRYYLGGLTLTQLGELMGSSKDTARRRLLEAVGELREICRAEAV